MLNSLEDYRDRMIAITDRAAIHLRECTPENIGELAKCRAEMSRVLTIFQLFVHREIFEPMGRSGDPAKRRLGNDLKLECIVLTEEFRHSARRWSALDLQEHWDEYQPEALAFRRRILTHLDRVAALARSPLLVAA